MDFNNMKQQDVENLYKALTSNNFGQLNTTSQVGGAALIPESLENSLRTLTYTEKQLQLWNDITKVDAYSTVEEYNVINSYGEDVSAFQPEGVAGIDTTSEYERQFAKIKCMNTTRSVTDLMGLVRTVADPEVLETTNGMKYLLGQTERALFYGDSNLAPGTREGLEWDGIFKQVRNANVMDLKGAYLTDKDLNKASETVLSNYGMPTAAYMPIHVSSKFSEQYYPNQRAMMNVSGGNVVAGTTVTQFNSIGGTIDIKPDVFMRRGLEALDIKDSAYGVYGPTAPSITASAHTDSNVESHFDKGGTFSYAVVAHNNTGKSAAITSDAIVVEKDGLIKLEIKNANAQISQPEYFVVYRTEDNKSNFYEIGRVGAKSQANGEITEFIDDNSRLPNTAEAIIGDFTGESVAFKQLAPMFKLPYAMTAPVKRFGIFLYGSPIVYAPKRFVTIKNIKVN